MSKKSDKKREMFDKIYKPNWGLTIKHPKVSVTKIYHTDSKEVTSEEDMFVCPLCLREYNYNNSDVTFEHVPPKNVGGNIRALTCRDCNSDSGSKLDNELKHQTVFQDINEGIPGASLDIGVIVEIDGEVRKLPATLSNEKGMISVMIDANRTSPNTQEHLTDSENQLFHNGLGTFTTKFSYNTYIPFRSAISRLRIAYLWAFSVFGYGFIVNPNMEKIRKQIKNPEEKILSHWEINGEQLQQLPLGISIIFAPPELQSFLVIFETVSANNNIKRHGILLPGFVKDGLSIYDWIKNQPDGKQVNFDYLPLNNEQKIRKTLEDDPLLAFTLWRKLTTNNGT